MMADNHLTNDEFFSRLNDLFEHSRSKGHGSIYLTQKRFTFASGDDVPSPTKVLDDPLWDTHPENPLPVLVRASNSKSDRRKGTDREDVDKVRLSTVVQPEHLDVFYARYAEACKVGMSGLKKRDKKKKKKDKKKKKGDGEIKA